MLVSCHREIWFSIETVIISKFFMMLSFSLYRLSQQKTKYFTYICTQIALTYRYIVLLLCIYYKALQGMSGMTANYQQHR